MDRGVDGEYDDNVDDGDGHDGEDDDDNDDGRYFVNITGENRSCAWKSTCYCYFVLKFIVFDICMYLTYAINLLLTNTHVL